jgi:hypothetical protein
MGADVAEVQMMQEGVDPAESGAVNSVERALQNAWAMVRPRSVRGVGRAQCAV